MAKYSLLAIKGTEKKFLGYWGPFILYPVSRRILWLVANYTNITPDQVTITGFLVALVSAWCFLQGTYFYLILGGILFQLTLILDLVDGGLARLKGLESRLGRYLDWVLDVARTSIVTLGLVYGQYLLSEDVLYFVLGFAYLSLMAITVAFDCASMSFNVSTADIPEQLSTVATLRNKGIRLIIQRLWEMKRKLDSKGIFPFLDSYEVFTLIFLILPLLQAIRLGLLFGCIWLLFILTARFLRLLARSPVYNK